MIETTLNGKTKDIVQNNIEQLKQIFPEIVTENKIDFDKLKEIMGEEIDDTNEQYNFTWKGKHEATKIALTPSEGTLRPDKESSKNWDTTENLYIEGDNLEVLKLLQKSYHGKIKMIYLDPPYNTGKDFVYKDDFKDNLKNYIEQDEDGFIISSNPETSGRFHTNWLNMIFSRLKLARNLLNEEGVIFISIDDSEYANLKLICNEIFGESNFIASIIWERAFAPVNLKKHFSTNHDYVLCYAKNIDKLVCNGLKRTDEANSRYSNPDNDIRGVWTSGDFSVGPRVEKNVYEIKTPSGRVVLPPSGRCWRVTEQKFKELVEDNRVWFGENGDGVPRIKRFLTEVKTGITPMTIWKYVDVGHSQEAKHKLKELFGGKAYFDYPKSVNLIKRMIELYTSDEDIIMDFFSGSATTAHAVNKINIEENTKRKYIMVQLPEKTGEKTEAFKAGYKNICEIGKERIRLAGVKLIEENPDANIDIGFKVFKLDSSNLTKWNPDVNNLENSLISVRDNIVEGRNELDLVYEIMLKYGLELTLSVEVKEEGNYTFYSVGMGSLIVCLNNHIKRDIAENIINIKKGLNPSVMRVVFKDNGFESDSDKTNIKEILRNNEIDEFITI